MTKEQALNIAEKCLYSHHIQTPGAIGWRCYTDRERNKLKLLAYTIYYESKSKPRKV